MLVFMNYWLERFLLNHVKFPYPLTFIPILKIKLTLRLGYNHKKNEIWVYRALFTYVLSTYFLPSELHWRRVIWPDCDVMDVACGVSGYQKRCEYPPDVSAVHMTPMLRLIPVICYCYQISSPRSQNDRVKHTCTVHQWIL